MKPTFVYIDRKPDGTPFYIGIGGAERVAHIERNTLHRKICNKYPGWTRKVYCTTVDWTLACRIEQLLIARYGRIDLKTGTLANLTDGGEGNSGYVYTEEQREALRAAMARPEVKEKQRASLKAAMASPEVKARRSATMNRPEVKARHREATKAAMASPEAMARHRAAMASPEVKAKLSAAMARPEYKAKHIAATKAAMARPEVKAAAYTLAAARRAFVANTGHTGRADCITHALLDAWNPDWREDYKVLALEVAA